MPAKRPVVLTARRKSPQSAHPVPSTAPSLRPCAVICTLIDCLRPLALSTILHADNSCRLLEIPSGLLQVEVALLVRPASTEASADECGPGPALE